jgi:N-acetylglutamate synthase-like GNAT family acetyltransferase
MPPPHHIHSTTALRDVVYPMEERDLENVLQIQKACYDTAFHEPRSAFLSKLVACPHTCWVVRLGTQACAYLVCLPIDQNNMPTLHASAWRPAVQPTLLYLHDLAIDPTLRGRGISHLLLDAATAYANDQRLPRLGLIAVQDSQRFWRKQGFKSAPAPGKLGLKKLASFGSDSTYMERDLP